MASGLFTLKQQLQGLIQKAWTGSQTTNAVEYLVVAGGGAGGRYGGGGGAGGLIQGISNVTTGTSITVTVGSGGATNASSSVAGGSGNNSVFGSITAIGGGGAGSYNGSGAQGVSGGSGGGGAWSTASPSGQGTFGQGNTGGTGDSGASYGDCAGGGGAGTVGLNAVAGSAAGNGGAGIASVISGTVTAYAGGGGGASGTSSHTQGVGGVGGGGAGSYSSTGTAGTANTGGGGGGAVNNTSGAGGSGIVIISYPDTYNAPSALTGTYTASTSGSGSIYYVNAGGSGPTSAPTFIQFANTTAFQTGTTATYEAWVYPTAFTTNHRIMSQQGANSGIEIYYDSSGNVSAGYTSGGASASVSSSPLSLNTWYHIAAVFTSGTLSIYINGVSKTLSGTTTGYNFTSTNPLFVGSYSNGNQYGIIGYLSNVRVVKGVAVYTGAFTTPTAPLSFTQPSGTNIAAITGTQTSLLLNTASGAFLTDSSTNSYNFAAISTGSAAPTWNQLSPFATGLGYKKRVYTWTASGTVTF